MHTLLRVGSLLLVIAYGAAYAQSVVQPNSATGLPTVSAVPAPTAVPKRQTIEEMRTQGASWREECMKDWDAATHMSKQEWARTCQRVVDERVKWLLGREQP